MSTLTDHLWMIAEHRNVCPVLRGRHKDVFVTRENIAGYYMCCTVAVNLHSWICGSTNSELTVISSSNESKLWDISSCHITNFSFKMVFLHFCFILQYSTVETDRKSRRETWDSVVLHSEVNVLGIPPISVWYHRTTHWNNETISTNN